MLGFKESEYRKTPSALRAYLNVVEVKMSAREWSAINYSSLPSELTFYTETHFLEMMRNVDENFYQNFQVEKKKINASTLFQVTLYINIMGLQRYSWRTKLSVSNETLEGLWAALPDYVGQDSSINLL